MLKYFAGAIVLALALPVLADEQAAVKPPQVGELDASRAGEIAVMMGEVLAIEPGPGGLKFYKVKPDQVPDRAIWATTFVQVADDQVKVGDRLAFKGYIAKTQALDPTGRLQAQLGAATLLQARSIETSLGSVQRDTLLPLQPPAR